MVTTSSAAMAQPRKGSRAKCKIWIDLENSPHVPFFAPIVEELQKYGCSVFLTARDCFQVRDLADLLHLDCHLVGRHYGKSNIRKMAGLCFRGLQLIPVAWREKPDLAVSHGSRSQLIASTPLGIPSLIFRDYEFSTPLPFLCPTWLMCPQVIPNATLQCDPRRILKYPGIKEDVYVPRFVPDSRITQELGLQERDVVATIRPPANEAHYHSPHSETLFDATVKFLSKFPEVRFIVLPRNERQSAELKERWPDLFANRAMRIPPRVVDGLNLIWYSDLVVSGGGTMNREAAALGVPVYSVFRGNIGAVDRYLSTHGRLVLLENAQDVQTKIRVEHRTRPDKPHSVGGITLNRIVEQIVSIVKQKRPLASSDAGIVFSQIVSASEKGAGKLDDARASK